VAVATGPFGREELAAHAPDAILDDLTDPAALAAAVFGTAS
jgi:phosphoglycolate phosphatase-like HAD superfamily hydrolase